MHYVFFTIELTCGNNWKIVAYSMAYHRARRSYAIVGCSFAHTSTGPKFGPNQTKFTPEKGVKYLNA